VTLAPLAPSRQGTVVLNIGAGIGALVVHTPASFNGREIEVSPVGDLASRTQATVRARIVHGGVRWTMLIGGLPAGRYIIWRDCVTPLAEVEVCGGAVAEFTWPIPSAAV
jgi:hypothetical protein